MLDLAGSACCYSFVVVALAYLRLPLIEIKDIVNNELCTKHSPNTHQLHQTVIERARNFLGKKKKPPQWVAFV